MNAIVEALRLLSVLLAAAILGNWFLAEVRAARRRGRPWYTAYLSAPGLLILAALALPLLWWLARR